MKGILQK